MDSSSKPTAPSPPIQGEWMACHPGRDARSAESQLSLLDKVWLKGAEWIAALGGAFFVGALVAAVNFPHGVESAAVAGIKQALWTGFMAGFLTKFCRFLCTQPHFRILPPMVCATLGPSVFAIAGVSIVHHLEGTADPVASILITVILAPPGFWVIAHNMRRAAKAAENNSLQINSRDET